MPLTQSRSLRYRTGAPGKRSTGGGASAYRTATPMLHGRTGARGPGMVALGVEGTGHAVTPHSASMFHPFRTIFANPVEHWDARYGLAFDEDDRADTWTGQYAGTVLQAPGASQTCDYQETNAYFGGRPAVVTSRADLRCMRSEAAAFSIPLGSQLYMFAIARNLESSGLTTDNHTCCQLADSNNAGAAWITTGLNGRAVRFFSDPGYVSHIYRFAPGTNTDASLFVVGHDGAAPFGEIDGATVAAIKSPALGSDGTGTGVAIAKASIGRVWNADSTTGGSFEITEWGLALDTTEDERDAFAEYAAGVIA